VSDEARTSPWVHRLLLWGALAAVPLFLFGGTITTVGAGMAVQGWWDAEGHFMPLFPIDKWFRDFGTFVEHTHRQFGMVVGLCVLAATVVALRRGDRGARLASAVALAAVVAQGSLGGFRVLENSPELAFLHGVAGQGVFALLLGATLVASPRFRGASTTGRPLSAARLASWTLALAVFGQITLGAWYRHALRTGNARGGGGDGSLLGTSDPRLLTHLGIAFAVLALVVLVARTLKRAAGADERARPLGTVARRLHLLVGIQILLGFGAWLAYAPAPPGGQKAYPPLEITFAALHVLGGALLLAQSVQAALWCGRLSAAGARRTALDPAEAAA
jgi:cytochrome c oxidase assembly protein subunit 15